MSICPKCGKDNEPHYKFCLGCGCDLDGGEAESEQHKLEVSLGLNSINAETESRSREPQGSGQQGAAKKIALIAAVGLLVPMGLVVYQLAGSTAGSPPPASGPVVNEAPVNPMPQPTPTQNSGALTPEANSMNWAQAPLQPVRTVLGAQGFTMSVPVGLMPVNDGVRVFWQDAQNAGGQSVVFIQVRGLPATPGTLQEAATSATTGQAGPVTVMRSDPIQGGFITTLQTSTADKVEAVAYKVRPAGAPRSAGMECRATIQTNSGAPLINSPQTAAYAWGICGSLVVE